jgi:hypothetical protein
MAAHAQKSDQGDAASRSDGVAASLVAEDLCNERWYHAGHDLRLAASESVIAR